MGYQHKALITDGITTLPSSVAAVVTNPVSTLSTVRSIVLHNTGETAETVKLYRVKNSGGSVGSAVDSGAGVNRFFCEIMAPNQTIGLDIPAQGIIMDGENDTIQGVTTTANTVTMMADGGQQ